ncbi:MAG TPA: IS1634 family transposase [Verrucomicrobiales bacterium]|nr:IS1634 family transposase [Verrucomicrobiales bacterium]
MFLRSTRRLKDGKAHCYWSLVENRRCGGGRVVQQTVLYLGEINDSQKKQWIRAIEVFDEDRGGLEQLKLFAAARRLPEAAPDDIQVLLKDFTLHRPRQWGGCWLFTELWKQLGLDGFWRERLGRSREGTDWEHVLQVLCCYRLLEPGSEWRLHRFWFGHSAIADLLEGDFRLAAKDTLYRCHDLLLEHKEALFGFLRRRWEDLFGVRFEILLYDLTSTYFESDPPFPEGDKRKFGYSRDKRADCVQVVIALVVTPEGFPLAYEVMAGNTADKTTLRDFLKKIEGLHGKAERIWIMDRGIPTEEVLAEMRAADPPVHYLVGTPKGRLGKLESELAGLDWSEAREGVEVKLLPRSGEIYVLARSRHRVAKERAIRRRQLKRLWARLAALKEKTPSRDVLLLKLGAARQQSPAAWRLVKIHVSREGVLTYALRKNKLRETMRREGRYLLRSNLSGQDPARVWKLYMLLVQVEEAFRNLKGDLAVRPIHHQRQERIEAHILVSFLAFCLHATLRHPLRLKAPGLTPRSLIEQLSAIQMLDVHFPTTDGRTLVFQRYTMPDNTQKLLLAQLGLTLPPQSPPRITSARTVQLSS